MLKEELMPPKPKELFIYVNGEFLPDSQAKISVMDHGLLYGDGCFDALGSNHVCRCCSYRVITQRAKNATAVGSKQVCVWANVA